MARLTIVACASVASAIALEPAVPAAPAAPLVPLLPSASPDLKADASQQLMNFLQAKPMDASNAMLEASPAKPFYYPYTGAMGNSTGSKAAMMATYHTDMMALMYVYSFFIASQKLAVAAGGYELPKKDGKKSASSLSLEKKTMQGLNMMQNPFAMFWQKQQKHDDKHKLSKTVEHGTKDLERQPSSKADKKGKSKSSDKKTLHPSFLEVEMAPAAPLPALPSGDHSKADTLLKHLDTELLDAERGDTNSTKLDTLTVMSIQSIYFDVLANFHIVMAQLYSMPAAFAGLKKPTAKSYVTWTKVMAFYYWAGTQYFVDILDIQVLAGSSKVDTKPWDAYALRLKQYAFVMWYWEAVLTLYELKTPTKSNLVAYLKNMDTFKLCELALTCNAFAFMAEAGVKGSEGLVKLVPALGLMFAYTAFHQDFISYMDA